MAFSCDGTILYMLTEKSHTLEAFSINRETGELTPFFSGNTLPDDYDGYTECAAIHRDPEGKYLYLSNRGHDSITVYRTCGTEIEKAGIVRGEIEWPREFLITPDGDFMLIGNQNAATISIFAIHHETGLPEYTGKTFSLPDRDAGPVCFISIPKTDE